MTDKGREMIHLTGKSDRNAKHSGDRDYEFVVSSTDYSVPVALRHLGLDAAELFAQRFRTNFEIAVKNKAGAGTVPMWQTDGTFHTSGWDPDTFPIEKVRELFDWVMSGVLKETEVDYPPGK